MNPEDNPADEQTELDKYDDPPGQGYDRRICGPYCDGKKAAITLGQPLPIVRLSKEQTSTTMSREARSKAINAAHRATMSPHEHAWTNEEQFQMACFVLWAHQRLLAIDQAVRGELIHEQD